MMSSTPVSDLFSKVQDSLNSHCSPSIVQSFLNSDQHRKMREIWDGFASKHTSIDDGGWSLGGSNIPHMGCYTDFEDQAIYKNVSFSANGESYQGEYFEKLGCNLEEKKSWSSHKISPTCEWRVHVCYRAPNLLCKGNTVAFNLDDPKPEMIPQEAPDALAKRVVEGGHIGPSQATSNNPTTSQTGSNGTGLGSTLAIGAGVASTAYFAYKAYNETQSIYFGNKEEKAKASGWRALGYGAAAIASGALTAYAIKI